MSADVSLLDALASGNARKVAEQLHGATCDVCCQKRLSVRKTTAAGGIETYICDECTDAEHSKVVRLPRFRSKDERDAWMAGSKTRGEI